MFSAASMWNNITRKLLLLGSSEFVERNPFSPTDFWQRIRIKLLIVRKSVCSVKRSEQKSAIHREEHVCCSGFLSFLFAIAYISVVLHQQWNEKVCYYKHEQSIILLIEWRWNSENNQSPPLRCVSKCGRYFVWRQSNFNIATRSKKG